MNETDFRLVNDCPGDCVIRTLGTGEDGRWDEYVHAHPGSTFFHLSGWKRVIESSFNHPTCYLYAERNGELEGVMPMALIDSRLFGRALISSPFCVYGGALTSTEEARRELEDAALRQAERMNVDYLEVRNQDSVRSDWAVKDLYVTFRKSIEPDPDANLKAIPRKQRAMVRKGIDAGLESHIDPEMDRFYRAFSTSVRNLGTPVYSRKYFRVLRDVFGEQCEILTVTHKDKLIASVMSFYFRNEVLPYYGGSLPQARRCKGNDFMYWEVMRRSCGNGVEIFDYGRSKKGTGSYAFKKNWGFVPEPLYYQYVPIRMSEIPNVSPSNPRYERYIRLWKKLPLPLANLVGPVIAKDLG